MSNITHGMSTAGSGASEATLDLIYDLLNAYTIRIAVNSGDSKITYVGQAIAGAVENSAVWQIKRIDETTGTVVLFADGNTNFDNNWTNRQSLTYN